MPVIINTTGLGLTDTAIEQLEHRFNQGDSFILSIVTPCPRFPHRTFSVSGSQLISE
jgi:hypothetical protein